MNSLWSCGGTKWDSERVRGKQRETEMERTVKLNPNTPSHAIQNTVATGNTFTTHEPRYIPPNVGLHTVDFTDCYKFLWLRSVFFLAHIITAHSNSQFMVKQQQAIRFTPISVTYSSWYFYVSFTHRMSWWCQYFRNVFLKPFPIRNVTWTWAALPIETFVSVYT